MPGIYLTADKVESQEYGTPDQTKALYVSIKNPYDGDIYALRKQLGTWRKVMEHLIEQGYDGIINDDGSGEIIAFSPEQIKSVDNRGTFNANNPNIYHQKENSPKGSIHWDEEGFKQWFGDSKVVDEQGNPLVVYHGTNTELTEFSPEKIGSKSNNGRFKLDYGYFFSDDKTTAKGYAYERSIEHGGSEKVYPVYLSLQNPLVVDTVELYKEERDFSGYGDVVSLFDDYKDLFKEDADRYGHDGIIIRDPNAGESLYVAFDPEQIKSVDNRGTFNANNPNIYRQMAENKLAEDESTFAQAVEELSVGKLDPHQPITVMTTPVVMTLVNADILPVVIDGTKLDKIQIEHPGITKEVLNQIPRALTDPMMIFDSKSEPGRKVIVLDLKDANGITIIVPFELNATRDRYQVNLITSIYGKGNKKQTDTLENWFIEKNIKQGTTLYVNRQKTIDWLQSDRLQSPSKVAEVNGFLMKSIPDETALRKLKEGNPELYQSPTTPKGSIHWDSEGRAIITCFEGADASTVVHELVGHYFIQNLIDYGAQPDAPAWMQNDRKTALEFAGIENWETATDEEKRAAHEKLARAAEAYIMEGKAPSLETRSLFRRFSQWLSDVYQSIRHLNVELTDEVRGVFDRLLATQEEIEAVAQVNGYLTSLPQSVVENLTDRQKQELEDLLGRVMEKAETTVRAKLMQDISATRRQELDNERGIATEIIRKELENSPLYMARATMQAPTRAEEVRQAIEARINELIQEQVNLLVQNAKLGVEQKFNVPDEDGGMTDEWQAGFSNNQKWYRDMLDMLPGRRLPQAWGQYIDWVKAGRPAEEGKRARKMPPKMQELFRIIAIDHLEKGWYEETFGQIPEDQEFILPSKTPTSTSGSGLILLLQVG